MLYPWCTLIRRIHFKTQIPNFRRVGYQNNPSLTWGGRYKNIDEFEYILHDETGKILTSGLHSINLTEVIKNEKNYRLLIRAYVVDHKGCHGKDSNKTIIGKFYLIVSFIHMKLNRIKWFTYLYKANCTHIANADRRIESLK